MKIMLVGFSLSGKSSLAKKLSDKYEIPLLYLDKVHWLPNWIEEDKEKEKEIVKTFLDSHSSWVIDGNYRNLFYERRCKEADKILILTFNRFVCLKRAIKRKNKNKNQSRESMTEGCEEKLDKEFASWILKDGRSRAFKKRLKNLEKTYKEKTIRFNNQRSLNKYLSKI